MRANVVALLAAVALAVPSGCSDERTPVPIADVPARVGTAMCERLRECNLLGAVLLSQTTCEQIVWSQRNGELGRIAAWIADGTLVYDGDAMVDCLDDLDGLACTAVSVDVVTDTGRCGQALIGQVEGGAACESTMQCRAGNYCADELSCPGTCQPRVAAGGACDLDAECTAGLECAGGHCVALGQTGASCGGPDGATCAMGFQCATSAEAGTCQPITRTAASGDACEPSAGVLCREGLVCAELSSVSSTYECRAPSSAGGSCYRAVPSPCPTGQVCLVPTDQDAGVCTAQGAVGEACVEGSGVLFGCAAGATCDYGNHRCVALVDNGSACTVGAQCAGDCVGGTCDSPLACE